MIHKVRRAVSELGLINAGVVFLGGVLQRLSRGRARLFKYYLVVQAVPGAAVLPRGRGASIEVRRAQPGDPLLAQFPRPAHVIADRYRQGAECLVALKDGRFLGYLWYVVGAYQEDEVAARFIPAPEGRSAWDFDVYIAPEARLGPAFLRLWDEANRELRSRGVAWSVSRIAADNPASMNSHRRLGAAVLGSVTFLRVGGWQLMAGTIPPFFHLATGAQSFPSLTLDASRCAVPDNPKRGSQAA